MVEVVATDEFEAWFMDLARQHAKAIAHVVGLLEQKGVALGAPYSSAIKGSNIALRELRTGVSKDELRVFYAFDPKRQAVLLIGGVKHGDRFYQEYVPRAEAIWSDYLTDLKKKKEEE